jgi:hypothetical protein
MNGRSDEEVIEVHRVGNGLVVQGSPASVAAFIEEMKEATTRASGQSSHVIVDPSALVGHAAGLLEKHREYIEFSDRGQTFLAQLKAIPTEDGFFRGLVKQGKDLAGYLDWKPADLSPEQVFNLQILATQMALQAAIKDLTAAIERVEGKVDRLVELARSERLGAAAGDRHTLQPMVDRVRATGRLSRTDWSTVAPLGALIARDIESVRSYIRRQLAEVKSTPFARARADEANELADDMMKESVALLVVVESNYTLWQELRIAHAANYETDALGAIKADVSSQLRALTEADQHVVTDLRDVVGRLMEPTGYEGFAPLQRSRLRKHSEELSEVADWFSDQRHLDRDDRDFAELPDFSESLLRVRSMVGDGAQRTSRVIATTSARFRRRKDSTEVSSSDDED